MSKQEVYIIPRWGGTPDSDWYPWFKKEVYKRYGLAVTTIDMPNWDQPTINRSVNFLYEQIHELNHGTYLIGHSVGCQAIFRFLLSRIDKGLDISIGGLLFIAGWFEVDNPWDSIKPWIANSELRYDHISNRVGYIKTIISDNDPFTSNYEENQKKWIERLGASVTLYPNKAHFNQKSEEDVMFEFNEMLLHTTQNKAHSNAP